MITYSYWKYYSNGRLAGRMGVPLGYVMFQCLLDIQMEMSSKLFMRVCCYSREVSKKE